MYNRIDILRRYGTYRMACVLYAFLVHSGYPEDYPKPRDLSRDLVVNGCCLNRIFQRDV